MSGQAVLAANPKANYLAHKDEIDQAIHRVLENGWYILGQEVAAFEQEFGAYLAVQNAVGVGSGTDALQLALRAGGIGPGDGVVTVSHTAVATVAAIELIGALPVLVDIDPTTLTMDVDHLQRTVMSLEKLPGGSHLKAVIPVHLYGHPADMPTIMDFAGRYGLCVIEDCAQSHGAAIGARKTGAWGDLAAFSFYPTKNLAALGDGGVVVTNEPARAQKLRLLREYGWRDRYISDIPGTNSRLDELQAAVLRIKLRYLDRENERRREIARIYDGWLVSSGVAAPVRLNTVECVFHQYVVRSKNRDDLQAFLHECSVGTLIHYPTPIHLQPAYRGRLVLGPGGLPHTEAACKEILSLPMYAQLTDEQANRVGESVVRWSAQAGLH